MRKTLKILLINPVVLGLFIFLFIIIGFIAYTSISSRLTQDSYDGAYSQLITPPECSVGQVVNSPHHLGSDDSSVLRIVYNCNTTGGIAYTAIINNLKSLGYKLDMDWTMPNTPNYVGNGSLAYNFVYQRGSITANYIFQPEQPNNPVYSTSTLGIMHIHGIILKVQ